MITQADKNQPVTEPYAPDASTTDGRDHAIIQCAQQGRYFKLKRHLPYVSDDVKTAAATHAARAGHRWTTGTLFKAGANPDKALSTLVKEAKTADDWRGMQTILNAAKVSKPALASVASLIEWQNAYPAAPKPKGLWRLTRAVKRQQRLG